MKPDRQDDYCHTHGGWGSDVRLCKVCGKVSSPRTMPEIPKGLTFAQALEWGAKQINSEIAKNDP